MEAVITALMDTTAGQAVIRLNPTSRWPEQELNVLVFITIFFRRSAACVGSLSLLWATAVLLGGFNSSLNSSDFAYVTIISLVSATGLFSIIEDQTNREFVVWTRNSFIGPLLLLLAVPLLVIFVCLGMVPLVGAVACIVLSSKQLVTTQDYYPVTGLRTSLNIFYALALIQGVLFCIFYFVWSLRGLVKRRVRSGCGFSDDLQTQATVSTYLYYTMEKSRESSVADILTMNMVRCGVELLQTQSLQNHKDGIIMLGVWFELEDGDQHQRKMEVIMELLVSPAALDAIGRVKDWILTTNERLDFFENKAEKILRAFHDPSLRAADTSTNA